MVNAFRAITEKNQKREQCGQASAGDEFLLFPAGIVLHCKISLCSKAKIGAEVLESIISLIFGMGAGVVSGEFNSGFWRMDLMLLQFFRTNLI